MDEPAVAITDADVEAAHARLSGRVVRTPLISLARARRAGRGARLHQGGVSAAHRLVQVSRRHQPPSAACPDGARQRGVVACSSGNHAQGVAEAARVAGMPATIVMPNDAPAIKRARTVRSGATVVGYDRERDDRVKIANDIAAETGATFVLPL